MAFTNFFLKLSILILFCTANFFAHLQAFPFVTNTSNSNDVVTCIDKERNALLKFKEGLVDPSNFLSSWDGPDCCKWRGVTCNYPTGAVLKLDLRNPNCSMEFDKCLGGKLTTTALYELQYLTYLDLSYNYFSGLIPPSLGNLSNLRVLSISYNPFLVSDLNWLSGLSSLEFLDLSYVNLSLATTHWLQAVNMLPSLSYLYLQSSKLRNIPVSLPHVNLTSLSVLDLSFNNFSTQPPQWLFNISSLTMLNLDRCHFNGPISAIVQGSGFCSFQKLDLSQNDLSGRIDELVERSLSRCGNNSLQELYLSSNQLSGQLPDSLGCLKYFRTLDLYQNSISGGLPKSIGELLKLEKLDLGYNKINGSIPKSLGKLKNLQTLDLDKNDWDGVLEEDFFQGLSKLKVLRISSSKPYFLLNLSPNWVPPFSLTTLDVMDIELGPKFPHWLQSQTQITELILSNVSISEEIPNWLWNMSSHIMRLHLSRNQIRGTIPQRSVVFPSGADIDLSYNGIEGPLPLWPNVSYLNLANNSFSGPIPSNIGQIMSELQYLLLSTNSLNGSIPSSLGKMKYLSLLDIKNNHLFGEVHDSWMGENIRAIDLAMNNLSGIFLLHCADLVFVL